MSQAMKMPCLFPLGGVQAPGRKTVFAPGVSLFYLCSKSAFSSMQKEPFLWLRLSSDSGSKKVFRDRPSGKALSRGIPRRTIQEFTCQQSFILREAFEGMQISQRWGWKSKNYFAPGGAQKNRG